MQFMWQGQRSISDPVLQLYYSNVAGSSRLVLFARILWGLGSQFSLGYLAEPASEHLDGLGTACSNVRA